VWEQVSLRSSFVHCMVELSNYLTP
jgi:hypothetical protein